MLKLLDHIASIENLEGQRFDKIEKKVKDGELTVEGVKNIAERVEGLSSLKHSIRACIKAELSGGHCHFVMVKNKEWEVIDAAIRKAST